MRACDWAELSAPAVRQLGWVHDSDKAGILVTSEQVMGESPSEDATLPEDDDLVSQTRRKSTNSRLLHRRRLLLNSVIALAAVICVVVAVFALKGDSATTTTVQTGTVTSGSVAKTVSASGNVSTPSSVTANFQSGGQLVGVYVTVGQHVEVGQALAKIDDRTAAASLASAQASLGSAQANLSSARAKLTQTEQSLDLPTQQQAVTTAQQSVDNAVQNANTDQVALTNSVTQAQATFDTDNNAADTACGAAMTAPPSPPQTVPLPDERPSSPTDPTTCPAAWSKVTQDYWSLATAQSNKYQKTIADDQSIQNAQNQLTSAQINLQTAEQGNPATLASAQSQVTSAQSQVTSAQSQVTTAQKTFDETTLHSTVSGTVSAVNAKAGDTVSGGGTSSSTSGSSSSTSGSSGTASSGASSGAGSSSGFITLSEISGLEVTAGFSESDSANLKVGQSAEVTFSALTGTTVAGKVTAIASTSTVTNNVVTYGVAVALENAPDTVKAGMTATVVVTTAEVSDVVRVPTAAVRGRGTTGTVTVIKNGTQSPQAVGVGLRGDSFTEITSGLTAGQKIVVSTSSGSFTGGGTGGGGTGGTGGGGLGGGLGGGGFGPPGGR